MTPEDLMNRNIETGFVFKASRSSGPGGQNVNKVSSKVELRFDLLITILFSDEEKETIFRKLKNRINSEGELIIVSQSERSQVMNRKAVIEKFYQLVSDALTPQAVRKRTKPSHEARIERLNEKKARAIIKKYRRKPGKSDE